MSFSHFSSLLWYVWMYSIRSHSHWNMLLHSEWVNLYVTASRVGSSFDGEPCLICLWLQRGLRHASCPCSALINGSGEREEGEKVCVRPRQRLWGFSQLNYIKRQSPTDTNIHTHSTHIHIQQLNIIVHPYTLSHVWMSMNVLTSTLLSHTLGGIHWNKTAPWWGGKLFRSDSRGMGGSPYFHSLSILLQSVSYVCLVTQGCCLFVFSVPTRQDCNWMLPVPPSQSLAKHCHSRLANTTTMLMTCEHHRGPRGMCVHDNLCVSVCVWVLYICLPLCLCDYYV